MALSFTGQKRFKGSVSCQGLSKEVHIYLQQTGKVDFLQWACSAGPAARSTVSRTAAWVGSGNAEMQTLRPLSHLLNENLHFNKNPRRPQVHHSLRRQAWWRGAAIPADTPGPRSSLCQRTGFQQAIQPLFPSPHL